MPGTMAPFALMKRGERILTEHFIGYLSSDWENTTAGNNATQPPLTIPRVRGVSAVTLLDLLAEGAALRETRLASVRGGVRLSY